jgi:hypothetical protein
VSGITSYYELTGYVTCELRFRIVYKSCGIYLGFTDPSNLNRTAVFERGHDMAEVAGPRPLTAETRVRSRVISLGFVVHKLAMG